MVEKLKEVAEELAGAVKDLVEERAELEAKLGEGLRVIDELEREKSRLELEQLNALQALQSLKAADAAAKLRESDTASAASAARTGSVIGECERCQQLEKELLAATQKPARKVTGTQTVEDDAMSVASAMTSMSGESERSVDHRCGVGMRVTNTAPHRVASIVEGGPAARTGQITVQVPSCAQ